MSVGVDLEENIDEEKSYADINKRVTILYKYNRIYENGIFLTDKLLFCQTQIPKTGWDGFRIHYI